MIACGSCGKSHRSEEQIEKCVIRLKKREKMLEKKRLDLARRRRNAALKPPEEVIFDALLATRKGNYLTPGTFSQAVAKLNKDYEPPKGKDRWDLVDAVQLDNKRLNWPF